MFEDFRGNEAARMARLVRGLARRAGRLVDDLGEPDDLSWFLEGMQELEELLELNPSESIFRWQANLGRQVEEHLMALA